MAEDGSSLFIGTLAHIVGDPFVDRDALEILPRGGLLVDELGKIVACGSKADMIRRAPQARQTDFGDMWIIPGLIDGHIHYPQTLATACPGGHLLEWLENCIFPREAQLADEGIAAAAADRFVDELLASGTTVAAVYGSQFNPANRLLLERLGRRRLRAIVGVTLMNRDCPESLCLGLDEAAESVEELFDLCRDYDHVSCAVTPRFALSCTPDLLELCGHLVSRYPDCYVQTHINENAREIHAVRSAFPSAESYVDVYDRFNLLGSKTLLAHSIHTTPEELDVLAERGCVVCHCPSSNLFLGSGIFPLRAHRARGIRVMLGTDVGAGPTFSIIEEMVHAQMLQKFRNMSLDAGQMLYLGTMGAARALGRDGELGNFRPGKWADFAVLNTVDDPYIRSRLGACATPSEALFAALMWHKGRHVQATYIAGAARWEARSREFHSPRFENGN